MRALLITVGHLLVAIMLAGEARAGLERKGYDAVLTDTPRCQFAWPGWDYTNITNPLLLTKNTLDRSMIGIMRIRSGDTLPRGKTKVASKMTVQQITSVLRANLQDRSDAASIIFGHARIAGRDAVRVVYTRPGTPTKRGIEYGFTGNGYFFHLLFLADQGPEYTREQKDFEHLASTFRILE